MLTHIETLSSKTPKGRRRVRKALGLKPGAPVTMDMAFKAADVAKGKERKHTKRAA